ncbi:MAG: sigma factor [Propioniciclava sp.]
MVTPLPRSHQSLLTAVEEVELSRRIDAGVYAEALARDAVSGPGCTSSERDRLIADGRAAYHRLIEANTGLVWFVVRPVADRTGLDRGELVQEGMVGLIEAVRRFDPSRGRFAGFAVVHIRARVGDAAATALGGLGLPAKRAHAWWQVRAVSTRLAAALGREPTRTEIAEACGRPLVQVADLLAWEPAQALPAAESAVADPPEGAAVVIGPELWAPLSSEQRSILRQRFGLDGAAPASYAAIAARVGMSEATVRRRERAALAELRAHLDADLAAA